MSFEAVMPPYNASDPSATFLSSSCLDFLLIELVPMAYRVTNELEAAAVARAPPASSSAQQQQHQLHTGADPRSPPGTGGGGADGAGDASVAGTGAGTVTTAGAVGVGGARKMDEEEEREAVFFRLEMQGYRVGQGLVERYVDVTRAPFFCFLVHRGRTTRPFRRPMPPAHVWRRPSEATC